MEIAIFKSAESLELIDLDVEHDVRIYIDRLKRRLSQAYDLIILFNTIEFDPLDMVFNRIRMRHFLPNNNSHAVGALDLYNRHVFLFALVLGAF
jgi:hypothetical protein